MSKFRGPLLASALFFGGFAALLLWYLWDVQSESHRVINLILILPLTLIAALLCAAAFREDYLKLRNADPETAANAEPSEPFDWRIPGTMLLLGIYTMVTMTYGIFDIATFVYMALSLWVLGERRPWVILLYSAVFTLVIVSGLKAILSYDVPTILL